ncbi:hypothetical protein [Haloferula sp. BvORR071]|uniref:hypothetical protein n=1 Tax=Haloferula sp. BvORR071 TaxID=1396141 RepID=UPI002240F910|nr:hypothetical protein [Haloferula sp. BvORR071]
MKSPAIIPVACVLTGFAVGWLVKPAGEAPVPTAATETAGNGGKRTTTRDGKASDRDDEPPLVRKAKGGGPIEADKKVVAAEQAFNRTFSSAGDRSRTAQLNRLAEALGLSPDQKDSMSALLSGRREGFKDLQGRGKNPAQMVAEAANAERIYEKAVREILDDEQVTAYDQYKAREKANDIESRAQRNLSDLVGQIDLSPSQRDQAAEALRASSTAAFAQRPEGWGLINDTMSVMGGAYVDAFEDMSGSLDNPEALNNSEEVQNRIIGGKRAAMEERLSRLSGILTPGQLAQYRAAQEARISFIESSRRMPTPTSSR